MNTAPDTKAKSESLSDADITEIARKHGVYSFWDFAIVRDCIAAERRLTAEQGGAVKTASELLRFIDAYAYDYGMLDKNGDPAGKLAPSRIPMERALHAALTTQPQAEPPWDFGTWRTRLMELVHQYDTVRDGTPSKAEAYDALWKHAGNVGDHWKARQFLAERESAQPQAAEPAEWKIDYSTGRPILVYKDCSVIEAEQAYLVLALLNSAASSIGAEFDAVEFSDGFKEGLHAKRLLQDAAHMLEASEGWYAENTGRPRSMTVQEHEDLMSSRLQANEDRRTLIAEIRAAIATATAPTEPT